MNVGERVDAEREGGGGGERERERERERVYISSKTTKTQTCLTGNERLTFDPGLLEPTAQSLR